MTPLAKTLANSLASHTPSEPEASLLDPETWSNLVRYSFITIGIVVVLVCLVIFMYELSDQYRTARFVGLNQDYDDDERELETGSGSFHMPEWREEGGYN